MSRHFYDKLYLRARAMLNFIEDIMIQIRINKNYIQLQQAVRQTRATQIWR